MEFLEFHLWYLRAKGWVDRLETGQFAITADGVDQVEQNQLRLSPHHLLEAHTSQAAEPEKRAEAEEHREPGLLPSE